MNSIGKWYLWLNEPADKRAFWDGNGWSARHAGNSTWEKR